MDKIKEFFQKKVVIIVEAVIMALACVGLLIGGISAGTIAKIPNLVLVILTAIEALITFIQGLTAEK